MFKEKSLKRIFFMYISVFLTILIIASPIFFIAVHGDEGNDVKMQNEFINTQDDSNDPALEENADISKTESSDDTPQSQEENSSEPAEETAEESYETTDAEKESVSDISDADAERSESSESTTDETVLADEYMPENTPQAESLPEDIKESPAVPVIKLSEQKLKAVLYTDKTYGKLLENISEKMNITLEGRLPDGSVAKAYPVIPDALTNVSFSHSSVIAAFDIKIFCDDGTEFQPESGTVAVSVSAEELTEYKAEDITVYHIDEKNKENIIECVNENAETIRFETEGFSVFVITLTAETISFELNVELAYDNGSSVTLLNNKTITVPYDSSNSSANIIRIADSSIAWLGEHINNSTNYEYAYVSVGGNSFPVNFLEIRNAGQGTYQISFYKSVFGDIPALIYTRTISNNTLNENIKIVYREIKTTSNVQYLKIVKIWSDGALNHTNDEVTVSVYNSSNTLVQTVTLNASNDWYEFVSGLSTSERYRIEETSVTRSGADVSTKYTYSVASAADTMHIYTDSGTSMDNGSEYVLYCNGHVLNGDLSIASVSSVSARTITPTMIWKNSTSGLLTTYYTLQNSNGQYLSYNNGWTLSNSGTQLDKGSTGKLRYHQYFWQSYNYVNITGSTITTSEPSATFTYYKHTTAPMTTFTITNTEVPDISYEIVIKKVDSADGTVVLPGAKMNLYDNSDNILESNLISQSDGFLSGTSGKVFTLPAGVYYLMETEAPAGYVCDTSARYYFTIDASGTVTSGTSGVTISTDSVNGISYSSVAISNTEFMIAPTDVKCQPITPFVIITLFMIAFVLLSINNVRRRKICASSFI